MSGTFIVIEGPDGAGTTSHAARLAQKLRDKGLDVILTAEPTGSPIGKLIRSALFDEVKISPTALQLLFSADRALHVDTVIIPALKAGKVVISDRYLDSTLAYGEAAGINPVYLEQINANFPRPDLLFYLLPSAEICMERIRKRDKLDVFENREFLEKVHGVYGQRAKIDSSIHVIDTDKDPDEAAGAIELIVQEALK